MKLIISIIFLIISICIAYKINNNNNDNHNIESSNAIYINIIPYDDSCSSQVAGVGFGSLYDSCFTNFSADVGSNSLFFTDHTQQYVNMSSYYHDQYCAVPIEYSKIYKNGECGFYEYSQSNYAVSVTNELPNFPKNSFVIISWDEFCESRINYWYAASGTSIPDHAVNQTNIYTCVGTSAYVTTCDGVEPGHTSNCFTLSFTRTCGFLINPNQEIYCTGSK